MCRDHGSPLRLRSLDPPLLVLSFCLLLATPAPAQQSESPSLPTIIGYVQTLEARLESREAQAKAQVIYWQNTVDALKRETGKDRQSSIESSKKLSKAQAELSKSQTAYKETVTLLALSDRALNDYIVISEKQIRGLELKLRVSRYTGTVVSLSLAATGVYIIGDKLGLW